VTKARNAESCAEADATRLVIGGISELFSDSVPSETAKNKAKNDFLAWALADAPVTGFRVMKRDVLTVRTARYPDELAARLEGCTRGKIETLSMASRRRLAIVAANTEVCFRSFVTVTYPKEFPCDGVIVKEHLHLLLAGLRRKCLGVSYLWFLEFQRRGAPHLHLFLSAALPEPLEPLRRVSGRVRKVVMIHRPWQDWLSRLWFKIVGSGDEKHLRAGAAWEVIEKPDGAARYVAKEAYKTFQKVVPDDFQNVGRFWGCSRDVPPDEGFVVHATQAQIAAIFPDGVDAEGRPFPVMFGSAEAYEKIRDTVTDPAKFNSWKRGARQKMMTFAAGSFGSETHSLKPKRKASSRRANMEWHGSTMNGSANNCGGSMK
jgi:hypothetical protein